MNILKIIKELYTGRENLVAQMAIFALVGIMAISFNEITSVFTGNTLYAVFAVPTNNEVILFSLLGIMIFIFFTGYSYKFVHENYKNETTQLPTISMNCFTAFIKIFPVMFVWGLYLGVMGFIGLKIFNNRIELFIYAIFLLILLPFINMVFIRFAKDFKYSIEIFNPLIIVKIMSRTFVKVFSFILQFIIVGFLTSSLFICIRFTVNGSRFMQIISTLAIICVSTYLQQVLNLAYYKGLTEIIKKNEV